MEQGATFDSADGLRLSGTIHTPDDMRDGEKRPAFIVLHGFGSNSSAGNTVGPARMLCDWGYVVLRFDMRGCGDSDGEFGRILCLDQVEDTRHALTYLENRPEVLGDRIGLLGSSFGAAVSLYTAGIDERPAAVVASGSWGNGETKFRAQHASPEAWARFTGMLVAGAAHKKRTGESLMVSRYDIVPIPEHLRGHLANKSVMEFPAETAQSMFDFRAEEVVGRIAPRPLLLMHASEDSVCPCSQSIELFRRAGQPADLHLLAEVDHFMFAEDNVRAIEILRGWLDGYFPAAG